MSELTDCFLNIANAIRTKLGSNVLMTPIEMPDYIMQIHGEDIKKNYKYILEKKYENWDTTILKGPIYYNSEKVLFLLANKKILLIYFKDGSIQVFIIDWPDDPDCNLYDGYAYSDGFTTHLYFFGRIILNHDYVSVKYELNINTRAWSNYEIINSDIGNLTNPSHSYQFLGANSQYIYIIWREHYSANTTNYRIPFSPELNKENFTLTLSKDGSTIEPNFLNNLQNIYPIDVMPPIKIFSMIDSHNNFLIQKLPQITEETGLNFLTEEYDSPFPKESFFFNNNFKFNYFYKYSIQIQSFLCLLDNITLYAKRRSIEEEKFEINFETYLLNEEKIQLPLPSSGEGFITKNLINSTNIAFFCLEKTSPMVPSDFVPFIIQSCNDNNFILYQLVETSIL